MQFATRALVVGQSLMAYPIPHGSLVLYGKLQLVVPIPLCRDRPIVRLKGPREITMTQILP